MVQAIEAALAGINHELAVFIISMVPIIELRGAIPYAVALDVEWHIAYVLAVIGNMVPVPFIILFFRPVIEWLEKTKIFGKIATKLKKRTTKKMDDMEDHKRKYKMAGLFLFVALPVPGTGAWTGAAIAALMKLRLKQALPVIAAGVATAGVIMLTGSKIVDFIVGLF